MNLRELRIGNYVEVDKIIAIVTAIYENENELEVRIAKDTVIKVSAEVAEPMPLTKELLTEHGGFNEDGRYTIGLDNHLHFLEFRDGYVLLADSSYEPVIHFWDVNFLHRLQNLYFAVTGSELEFTFND